MCFVCLLFALYNRSSIAWLLINCIVRQQSDDDDDDDGVRRGDKRLYCIRTSVFDVCLSSVFLYVEYVWVCWSACVFPRVELNCMNAMGYNSYTPLQTNISDGKELAVALYTWFIWLHFYNIYKLSYEQKLSHSIFSYLVPQGTPINSSKLYWWMRGIEPIRPNCESFYRMRIHYTQIHRWQIATVK